MPIYEYQCTHCGHIFEEIQKITDDPVLHCPECNNEVKRIISSGSFRLPGDGWYKKTSKME